MTTLSELASHLQTDPWRNEVGFSDEVATANAKLFDASLSVESTEAVLNDWIHRNQPCLFGRIAAKCGFLSYCVLREDDIARGDQFLRDKVQDARLEWTRKAHDGRKNGFIISLISPRLATALPDDTVKSMAIRLASLYLLEDVRPDEVFLDTLWLEKPGPARTKWEWKAGVNYFCAQGDKRWWQDHRFPGGMAFSVNSVGHMVKSGILGKAMTALNGAMGVSTEDWSSAKVDSLEKALELAMKTIANASKTVSGPATELIRNPSAGKLPITPCPILLPPTLSGKSYCSYLGRYHTDYTVPSEYFLQDVARPEHLVSHILDFTYLYDRNLDNPAHETMGRGRQVRIDRTRSRGMQSLHRILKTLPKEVQVEHCLRLTAALGLNRT